MTEITYKSKTYQVKLIGKSWFFSRDHVLAGWTAASPGFAKVIAVKVKPKVAKKKTVKKRLVKKKVRKRKKKV